MPRNGSGGYLAPLNSWNPAINGQEALPDDWMAILNDVSAALQASVASDGQTPMSGALKMGGNKITGLGAPSSAGGALRWEQNTAGVDIASATNIVIPNEGALFSITGTTQIDGATGGYPGRTVAIKFVDDIILKNGINFLMPSGRDFSAKSGQIVFLLKISEDTWQLFSGAGSGYSFEIGDFLDSARTMDAQWIRRDGALYNRVQYPELASLMPVLPDGFHGSNRPVPIRSSGPSGSSTPIIEQEIRKENGQYILSGSTYSESTNLITTWQVYTAQTLEAWFKTYDANVSGTPAIKSSLRRFSGNGTTLVAGATTRVTSASHFPLYYSTTDAASWTQASRTGGLTTNVDWVVADICWVEELELFVAILNGGTTSQLWTSSDGMAWTAGYTFPSYVVTLYVDGLQVLAIGRDNVYSSFDASIWTAHATGITTGSIFNAYFFVFNGTYHLVVGSTIKTSTDLDSWVDISPSPAVTGSQWTVVDDKVLCLISGKINATEDFETFKIIDVDGKTIRAIYYDELVHTLVLLDASSPPLVHFGTLINSDQFQVPDDNPTNGWIKAL